MNVKSDHPTKFSNLSNWKEEAWKKSGLQQNSNPWPPLYRCDALPTELWSHTLVARSIFWVHIFLSSEMMWYIYEIIHIELRLWMKVESDHRSKFSNLKAIGKKKPEKNQGLNRIRTHDLQDTSAMLYQLSYEATHWERGQFIEFIFSCAVKWMWYMYEIIHIWTAVVDESKEWSLQ